MMARELTPRQLRFVQLYLRTGNATRAAREAGYRGDDNSVAATASRMLRNVKIREYLEAAQRDLEALFAAEAWESFRTLRELRDHAESEQVRLRAAQDLLDRAGYRPPDRVEHGGQVAVSWADLARTVAAPEDLPHA